MHYNGLYPLISVLLPVYNAADFVYSSIESILNQTYTNFELLILDDASNDGSMGIIQTFSDRRIRLFTEKENMGIVYQLNKGLHLSHGTYIARMDADDFSFPDRFRVQIEYMMSHPHIDVLGCQAEMFGDKAGVTKFPTCPGCADYLLNYYCTVLHPSVMIKSEVFTKRGFRYRNIPYAEDYMLWIDISNGNNISSLQDVLLKYRIHKGQTNQIRFDEQYQSSIKARSFKIQKTYFGTSRNFQALFNHLANDYIFYGERISTITDELKINLWDSLSLRYNHFLRYSCKKPIVDFVYSSLKN